MLQFSLLGSGSKGNATLIRAHGTKILIDCGFSGKELLRRLACIGEDLDGLDAIFVTHEHSDHVEGLGVISRRINVPVYLTYETRANLPPRIGDIANTRLFEAGDTIVVGALEVTSFSTSHDAADPVSYTVAARGAKVGFAHDLGHCSQLVRTRLAGSHSLVLESNYCPEMLRNGPYPPELQQRIRSRIGHLSNQDMNSLLHELLHDCLRTVVLAHISEKNNNYDLAQSMAEQVLRGHHARLIVARQDAPTGLIEVSP